MGGDASFPLVVLAGGREAGFQKFSGRELFDAFARRGTPSGSNARQALVRALAGVDSPWEMPGAAASPAVDVPAATRRMAIAVSDEVSSAQDLQSPSVSEAAPARVRVKVKLRMATRGSMPPSPRPAGVPDTVAEPVLPELPPMPPPALAPSWNDSGAGSPMVPIPEPGGLSAPSSVVRRFEANERSRPLWPAGPPAAPLRAVPPSGVPPSNGAFLPVQETPSRSFLRPIVAVLLATAVLLGAGEWWRKNQRAKAHERASALARAASAAPLPASVEPAPKKPSEAFRTWGRNARISGVLERENGRVRALVNGRIVMDGDLVDAALELHLVGQAEAARRLIFEERGGARLEVEY